MAEFVGLTNRIPGTAANGTVTVLGANVPLLEDSAQTGSVFALVRPENVRVAATPDGTARVAAVSFLGSLCRAQVTLPDDTLVVAQMSAVESSGLEPGAAVSVSVVPAPVFAVAD